MRPEIVIIALTLAPESDRLDALFDAGAAGAVSKAAQPSALPTLIRETVDGRVLHLHKPAGAHPWVPDPPRPGSPRSQRESSRSFNSWPPGRQTVRSRGSCG